MGLLPTNVVAGTTQHTGHHNQAHGKLNEKISPAKDFGADDTGATDATVKLQQAYDAAGDGGWVDHGKGLYKVSDQGGGWCLDISAHDSIRLSGHGHPRLNPSAQGGNGAVIFCEQAGKQILRAVSPAGQNHAGPLIEHLRIEDRGGNGTCFYVDSVLHGTLFNVEMHGAGSGVSTSGYGMRKLETNGDASYWTYMSCGFLKNFIGFSGSSSDHFWGGYMTSDIVNAKGIELLPGTGNFTVAQTKFEFRGAGTAVAGCKGISIGGFNGASISLATFEGVFNGIYLEDLGAAQNTGVQLIGNMFTGQAATETCYYIGTNHQNANIEGGRYSNVATLITDNGIDTYIFGGRAASQGRNLASLGGVGILVGSGAPAQSSPNGTIYLRSDGSGTTDNLYIRRSAAWVGIA